MPHQRDAAAGPERGGRPGAAGGGLDPVKGLRGEDQIEGLGLQGPGLERRRDDLDPRVRTALPRGQRGERFPGLERRDRVASGRQRQRDLAGAAADLEDPGTGRELGQRHDRVDRLRRVSRPDLVVEGGDLVEGGGVALAHSRR
jgi:hypothetical protein